MDQSTFDDASEVYQNNCSSRAVPSIARFTESELTLALFRPYLHHI